MVPVPSGEMKVSPLLGLTEFRSLEVNTEKNKAPYAPAGGLVTPEIVTRTAVEDGMLTVAGE
jgi:hypothetical protein